MRENRLTCRCGCQPLWRRWLGKSSAAAGPLLLCLLVTLGCSRGQPNRERTRGENERLVVFTTNYPLAYFAQRIAGEAAKIVFPAPDDVDPAFWTPDETTIRQYQTADLILLNGADFERWTAKFSLPPSKTVNTSQAFADQYIVVKDAVVHTHGPGGEHSHHGTAFTTWLDPRLAIGHSVAIHAALEKQLPQHAEVLSENLARLRADLEALDARLDDVHQDYTDQPLLASHPVYQYLERRCGWNLRSLHWEPDEMPPAREWSALEKLLADHPAQWMIWEDTPAAEIEQKLAALGVASVVFAPCGNRPESGDYLQVMQANIDELARAVAGPN